MSYGRFVHSRNHKRVQRATGSALSLTATAVTELAAATNGPGTGGFDITLAAQVGDTLEWGFSGLVNEATGTTIGIDIYTVVSSAPVNPFGPGLSASLASVLGVPHWYCHGDTLTKVHLAGTMRYVVVVGDLVTSGGGTFVTMRPYYAKPNATARAINSTANAPLTMWATNLGPADPN